MEPTSLHGLRILASLNEQRVQGTFCDAMLSAPDGHIFKAHRSVLACCSELFSETYRTTPFVEVNLSEGCPSEGLSLLLDFIYTGQLPLTVENVDNVQIAAIKLSVPEALSLCQEFRSGAKTGECKDEAWETDLEKNKPQSRTKAASGRKSVTLTAATAVGGTTTRSGRKVKGPSHLLWDSLPTAKLPAIIRSCQTQLLDVSTVVEPSGKDENQILEEQSCSINEVEVEFQEATKNEEEESIAAEDIEEEYIPEQSPGRPHTLTHIKQKRRIQTVNKENGEGVPGQESKRHPVQCPTCHKTFLSKYYLKVHNRRHTGEKPFECGKCGKCYYRKENLLEHEARNCINRAQVVHTCPECPLIFQRRLELRMHMVTHTGEMPYKCTSCTEQFMQKKDLKSHLIKVHGAPKPHACSLCPKCFLSRTELRLHEASKHRGEKLFVCEECGHRASSRNGLHMHIKAIHRNERPFVCEFCNHAFTQKANLNMHLRTHTGEKPFQCHLCGKTFRTQASLDKHHRTHTGERPFHCEFCEQRFTEKGPLLRHIASKHQEGRPHSCHICNKTFKAIEQLRVHVRRHRGMRKFECTECGYRFTRQAHLRRHMQIHNRVENYNPRQRRLRNLVVEEKAEPSSEDQPAPPPGDIICVMLQPGTIVVEEVISTNENAAEQAASFSDVMEHTLMVTSSYPVPASSISTESLDGQDEQKT
ncbi:telomere zinc finger-associated protein [Erpetoichthys calabaricus]|uniref:Zinc finger and BTB domain containing 48 n=1 Tax=Erpetoichthys calabaricus TaxID=27687 RepID=A0A8C4X6U1_ERPCA|nr:telomere zinc finger-associated protein [Erpetoichthys calabaricus]